jgi:Nucleotidyl transferase AbiEii toxin, Type IV TA system
MALLEAVRMEIARRIAKYEDKGFARERAEINVLMENAAFSIFRDFPDAFVLFGGATLVLYHGSVRHSADLDLLHRASPSPSPEQIAKSLPGDLSPIAQIMGLGDLHFEILGSEGQDGKISVTSSSGQRLFRIDLTSFGSAIESQIEDHRVEDEAGISAVIKAATKELLLLQKAEAFLLRRIVKARDAYDIHLLRERGAKLSAVLQAHLQDMVLANELDSDAISGRINSVDGKLCRLELEPVLPPDVYSALEAATFEPLRAALRGLYKEWL